MKLPEIPNRGISKRGRVFIEKCLAYMRATTPVAGSGISLRELQGGTQINAAPGGAEGEEQAAYFIRNGALVRVNILICLLYTSDAADERSSVDLGGRRIIK